MESWSWTTFSVHKPLDQKEPFPCTKEQWLPNSPKVSPMDYFGNGHLKKPAFAKTLHHSGRHVEGRKTGVGEYSSWSVPRLAFFVVWSCSRNSQDLWRWCSAVKKILRCKFDVWETFKLFWFTSLVLPSSGLQNPHNGRLLLFINCFFLRLATLESVFAELHVKKATCITREGKLF